MRESVRARVIRLNGSEAPSDVADEVAAEEPLEIRVAGVPVSITMRTPGHDLELVAGFLLSEGVLACGSTPPLLRQEGPNVVNAGLAPGSELPAHLRRGTLTLSSCGLCGKRSLEAVHQRLPPVDSGFGVARAAIYRAAGRMRALQSNFERTGGVHAAAVFDRQGEPLAAREDVGRHNAVDKVTGYGLLRGLLPWEEHILLVSGRASFEIVQKALAARIPLVAAVSAPSSLAVQLAEESGQTLIGFLREGRMNVYAHPERITGVG